MVTFSEISEEECVIVPLKSATCATLRGHLSNSGALKFIININDRRPRAL